MHVAEIPFPRANWLRVLSIQQSAIRTSLRSWLSFCSIIAGVVLVGSGANAGDQEPAELSSAEAGLVTRAVEDFMAAVAKDITTKGPRAWREYLSQKQAFLMASNGELVDRFADRYRLWAGETQGDKVGTSGIFPSGSASLRSLASE